jgi:hypothetical protein
MAEVPSVNLIGKRKAYFGQTNTFEYGVNCVMLPSTGRAISKGYPVLFTSDVEIVSTISESQNYRLSLSYHGNDLSHITLTGHDNSQVGGPLSPTGA